MPNPVSPDLSVRTVHQGMRRLDVLVDEPPLMQLGYGPGEPEREMQERPHRHRLTQQPLQRLAAGILQHQHGPTAFADQLQRAAPPTLRRAHP